MWIVKALRELAELFKVSSVTVPPAAIVETNNYSTAMVYGNVVVFSFSYNTTKQIPTGSWTTIATIPAALRGEYAVGSCMCYDATVSGGACQVQAQSGTVRIQPFPAHANSANKLIRGQLIWTLE